MFFFFFFLDSVLISDQFHPTLYADIAGWGSTEEAGAKPYRHVPVHIIPPGNVASVSYFLWLVINFNLITFSRLETTLKR